MAKSFPHSQTVRIQDLKPGMMVVQVSAQNGPVKVRKSGLITSFEMVQGLTEMGVLELEIDPSQTLEIESEPSPRKLSQTQQLMQADSAADSLDASISDQFNRSLFMPSIRDLRSAWYYKASRVMTGGLVFLLGLTVGLAVIKGTDLITSLGEYSIVKDSDSSDQVEQTQTNELALSDRVEGQTAEGSVEAQAKQANEEKQLDVSNGHAEASNNALSSNNSVPQDSASLGENTETSARHPLDVELSEAEIQKRIIRPDTQPNAPVSQDLLAKFNKALSELEESDQAQENVVEDSAPNVIRIDQLPAWALTSLPAMSFSTHIFASNKDDRWVRVNGTQMREGDWIEGEVQIVEITQHHVVLNYQGQSFRMAALTDW